MRNIMDQQQKRQSGETVEEWKRRLLEEKKNKTAKEKELLKRTTFDPATGKNAYGQTQIEARTGILRPKYEGMRDETGQLKEGFKYDPTKSEAFQQLRQQAMAAPGESPWAKMQYEQQALEQAGQTDLAAKQQAQAQAQAQSNLARFGGLGTGARTSLARQGARDLMQAKQDVSRQGMMSRLGILGQDIGRQQEGLGKIGSVELEGQGRNIGALTQDVGQKGMFDMKAYEEQMAAYGAEKGADAQRKAARGGKK